METPEDEYIDCPECYGECTVMEMVCYGDMPSEVDVPCKFCNGMGEFSEDQYLVMRLKGWV